jgi:uncharacterized membrane protein
MRCTDPSAASNVELLSPICHNVKPRQTRNRHKKTSKIITKDKAQQQIDEILDKISQSMIV